MIHFTTFFALLVGGMEVIQLAAARVPAGLLPKRNLMNTFQLRQAGAPPAPPPQCANICSSVANIISGLQTCTPTVCCLASFENSYFNCFTCVEAASNVTNFTEAQTTLDDLYDGCASLGIQLPVLTFPGQNPLRQLSSVAIPISTVSSATSPSPITQSTITISPSTSTPVTSTLSQSTITGISQSTVTSVNTPTQPSSSVSSGIRSVETSCLNLITVGMMLGIWLYFAA